MNTGRRRFLVGLMAALPIAGCQPSGPSGVEFYRNKTKRISSTTRFDASRFAGRWQIRGEFVHPGEQALFGAVHFRESNGLISAIELYGARGLLERYNTTQPQPGRIVSGKAPFDTQYWVLWVDDDYRTAAIGTPSGSFGWIIDRAATGGSDRIKAAKEILGFNGYDLSQLQTR